MNGTLGAVEKARTLRRAARTAASLNEKLHLERCALLVEPLLREAFRSDRHGTLVIWARWLRDNQYWEEAEPLFREALQLSDEKIATRASVVGATEKSSHAGTLFANRGRLMHDFACGLRDFGHWAEAEALFRKALQMFGDDDRGRAAFFRPDTQRELARGLVASGRWKEAEPLLREALDREVPWTTQDALERELQENDRATKASPNEEPLSSSFVLFLRLARDLCTVGRHVDAEMALREFVRSAEDAQGRGDGLLLLGRHLYDQGNWREAEPIFAEALHTAEPRSWLWTTVLIQFAHGLSAHDRWPEAEVMLRSAIQAQADGKTPESVEALSKFLMDEGRVIADVDALLKLFGVT